MHVSRLLQKLKRMAPIFVVCFSFFFLVSSATPSPCSDRCFHKSKATYFPLSKLQPLSSASEAGVCGYGSLAKGFNKGYIAAGDSYLLGHGGIGCGSCFLVKCKNETLCRESGTKVVLTDSHKNSETDLILSDKAFTSMASEGNARELLDLGIVDVEYTRIRCEYKQNMSVRVDESSMKPNKLAITFLYQGGKTGIHAVDVIQERTTIRRYMTRRCGAVWEMSPVSEEPLIFSLLTVGGYDADVVTSNKALPVDWKIGEIYDLGVQMNEVIDLRDGCPPDCTIAA